MPRKIRIFSIDDDSSYAERVVNELSKHWRFSSDCDDRSLYRFAKHKCQDFTDGECLAWADENVRNTHCYVITSLVTDARQSVNDKLIKTMFFIGSLRDASARQVTLVTKFWPYGRQDRKDKPRKPVATKYRSQLFHAMKPSRIITMDVHNPAAEQNAPLGCPIDMLECRKPLAAKVAELVRDPQNIVAISPDVGGVERTKKTQHSIGKRIRHRVGYAQFNKEHAEAQETVHGEEILGEVQGKEVWMVDDMLGTCGTVRVVRRAVESKGGRLEGVVVTHGLGTTDTHGEPAWKKLEGIPHIVMSDSVDPFRFRETPIWDNIHIVDTAPLFAEAIYRTEHGGSIGSLLED